MADRRARLSLTRSQLATEAACVELLQLLQTTTADGRLSSDEVEILRAWLSEHETLDIPTTAHLREVLERVLADGIVTDDEARLVFGAVESVLPPEVRRLTQFARREADKSARAEQQAAKQRERAERVRDRPIRREDFMVAGVRYEGRWRVVQACVSEGDVVWLVREPGNPFSRNAIQVCLTDGQQIGYVPETLARSFALLLDEGARQDFAVRKILTYDKPLPVVAGNLFDAESRAGATVPAQFKVPVSGAIASAPAAPPVVAPTVTRTRPHVIALVIVAAVGAFVVFMAALWALTSAVANLFR